MFPTYYLHTNFFLKHWFPLIMSIACFIFSVKLYRFYNTVRDEYFYYHPNSGRISLLYISKLTYGAMLLSVAYILTEFTKITLPGFKLNEYTWPFLKCGIFAVFIVLCRTAHYLVDKEFKYDAVKKQNRIIKAMVTAAGGYVWYKDNRGRYLFCDPTWCNFFFGLPDSCAVIGFDDVELLNIFRNTKKIRHTFGDLCMNTDLHSIEQGKPTRYIECGYIGDKLVVLDVLKTPMFDDKGNYTGNVGFAWERSKECENIFRDIEIYINTGQAEELENGVYWLKEPAGECKWDKPFPSGKKLPIG